ncbi:MAG: tetratricopeptide repeat protein [Chloroflexi bacterium]|nr:tetratricopeptide repeat protein [Chloroflexota bacterium]
MLCRNRFTMTIDRKALLAVMLVILALIAGGCPFNRQGASLEDLEKQVASLTAAGKYEQAEKLCLDNLKGADPARAAALHRELGTIYIEQNKPAEAKSHMESVLKVYEERPEVIELESLPSFLDGLSAIYISNEEYAKDDELMGKGINLYKKYLEIHPADNRIRLLLGRAYLDETRYPEAVKVFTELLNNRPDWATAVEARIGLSQAKRIKIKFNEGIAGYDKLGTPGLDDLKKANAILDSGKTGAQECYLRCLLGEEYLERAEPDYVLGERNSSTELSPERREMLESSRRELEKAVALLDMGNVIEDEMLPIRTQIHLARIYLAQGKKDEARTLLDKARQAIGNVRNREDLQSLHFIMAETLHEIKDDPAAINELNTVLKLSPTNKDSLQAYTYLSRIYLAQGDYKKGIDELRKANVLLKERAGAKRNENLRDDWVFGMMIGTIDHHMFGEEYKEELQESGSKEKQELWNKTEPHIVLLNKYIKAGKYAEATKEIDVILDLADKTFKSGK